MICPYVTEHLRQRGRQGWETVFLLAGLIHFTGITFYGVFASGEQQEWAEPRDEQEQWKADKARAGKLYLLETGPISIEYVSEYPQ